MPSLRKCIIPDCKSNSSTTKLCKFPASSYIASLWKEILKGKFPSLKLVIAGNGRCQQCICSLHFEAKYIKDDGKRVYQAIPTLFTENEIRSGTPSQALSMVKNPEHEDLVSKIRTRPFTSGDKHNTVHHDHNYGQIQQMKLLLPNPPCQPKDTSLDEMESETPEDQDTSFLNDEDAGDQEPSFHNDEDASDTLNDQNVPPEAPVIATKTQIDEVNSTKSLPSYYCRKQTEYLDKYDRFALMIADKIREIVDSFERESLIISIKKLVFQTIDKINTRIRTCSDSDTSKMTDHLSYEHAICNTPNQIATSPPSEPPHNPVISCDSETPDKLAWPSASKSKLKRVKSRASDPVHIRVKLPEAEPLVTSQEAEYLTDPVTSRHQKTLTSPTFSSENTLVALRLSKFPQNPVESMVESHDLVTSGASETVHNSPSNPVITCASNPHQKLSTTKLLPLLKSKLLPKPVTSRVTHPPHKIVKSRVLRSSAARSAKTEFS